MESGQGEGEVGCEVAGLALECICGFGLSFVECAGSLSYRAVDELGGHLGYRGEYIAFEFDIFLLVVEALEGVFIHYNAIDVEAGEDDVADMVNAQQVFSLVRCGAFLGGEDEFYN